jgi:hypothetical protein
MGENSVKRAVLIAACLLLGAVSTAQAMSTVPYVPKSGNAYAPDPSNPYGIMRNPDADDSVPRPYGYSTPFTGNGGPGPGPYQYYRRGNSGQFLNIDPFDPNSVMNSYDRDSYANPYPYDPIYNPYGQAGSALAPRGGSMVPQGNGIPYGR